VVAAAALATVLAADLAIQRIAPVPAREWQLEDGLGQLERHDRDILIFGSSHTRSFHPLARELERRAGHPRAAIVTMESGWGISFDWVMQQRVAPLLDHDHAIHRAVVVLTFSDVCGGGDHSNLPRNAWRAEDFGGDVLEHGVNEYNRAYLTTRMNELLRWSILAQRGGNVLEQIKKHLRTAEQNADARARQIVAMRDSHFESQLERCPATEEVEAIDRVIDELAAHDIEVTLVMFPLVPSLVPDDASAVMTTYRGVVRDLAHRHGVQLLDWARLPIMEDADFRDDLDHLTGPGADKLMTWALAHDLSFLTDEQARTATHATLGDAP
jgi:hypothetical protein